MNKVYLILSNKTPLIYAIDQEKTGNVRVLLSNPAVDVNAQNIFNIMPFYNISNFFSIKFQKSFLIQFKKICTYSISNYNYEWNFEYVFIQFQIIYILIQL